MELADVLDSKSSGSDTVSVRPRSPAPEMLTVDENQSLAFFILLFTFMYKYDRIVTIKFR